jgi:hypothetical protein
MFTPLDRPHAVAALTTDCNIEVSIRDVVTSLRLPPISGSGKAFRPLGCLSLAYVVEKVLN